jgi:hypothetical protein
VAFPHAGARAIYAWMSVGCGRCDIGCYKSELPQGMSVRYSELEVYHPARVMAMVYFRFLARNPFDRNAPVDDTGMLMPTAL